jgi:hypothetical protein
VKGCCGGYEDCACSAFCSLVAHSASEPTRSMPEFNTSRFCAKFLKGKGSRDISPDQELGTLGRHLAAGSRHGLHEGRVVAVLIFPKPCNR